MKTLCNRIAILLLIAVFTTQCKKNKNEEESIAGTKDEWVTFSKDEHDLGDDAWGFSYGNKIYMYAFQSRLDIYDIQQKKWTGESIAFPAGFADRYVCQLLQYNNKIYIAGGEGESERLKDFWEFDPADSQWKKLADLPLVLSGGQTYHYNNTIYLGLGVTTPHSNTSQQRLYKYSLLNNAWDPQPVILNSYAGTNGISFQSGEEIFYGGGYGYSGTDLNPKTFYKYNLKTGAFTQLANLPSTFIENAKPNTFILGGKLYGVLGSRMLVYDISLNTWKQYDDLPRDEKNKAIYYCFQVGNKVIAFTQNGVAFEYL